MNKVHIIECPSNLGLKEPQIGKEPGVKYLPEWLRKHNFHQYINPEKTLKIESPPYSNMKDPETRILNADSIAEYSVKQADIIMKLFAEGKFPLLLGGDCSILIGSAIALKQIGDYALFYLDGHTDFMDISLSETGGAGGMAASIVTGNGHKKLTDILNLAPYIKEENLWCVGNREYDDEYENEIRNSQANYKSLEKLREEGIKKCVHSFLKELEEKQLDGFWLHIDVDVLNDEIMPCVDSRTSNGLTFAEFNSLIYQLLGSKMLAGFEITILDPELDPTGKFTKDFVSNITGTFSGAKMNQQA